MDKKIEQLINWIIIILVGLLPLFFLPLTSDFYDFNKNYLLMAGTLLLLGLWGVRMVLEKKVIFKITVFDLPVLAFALAYGAATLLSSPNRIEALILPGETGTILALALLYFIIINNLQAHKAKRIGHSLIVSGSILGLIALFQFIGLGEAFSPVDWLKMKFWTPAGNLLSLASFLSVVLVLVLIQIYSLWEKKGEKNNVVLPFYFFTSLLIGGGLLTSLYQLFSTAKPILLSYQNGWMIAIEALKNKPLFGIGPGNFISAFNAFRPIGFNLTDQWALKFGYSANFYLQLLTTTGIIGALAVCLLVWKIIKEIKNVGRLTEQTGVFLGLILTLILALVIPANFLLLLLLFLLITLFGLHLPVKELSEESKILPVVIALPCFLLLIGGGWFLGRTYAAELAFNQSLEALRQNQGTQTYNLLIKAISLNPYSENYRLNYSQVNLALANAIASQSDLTDQDRNNISALVQQAIREAKAVVTLNPQNANNWTNLALIYRQLINFADGAENWALTSYQQAIALDPFNPQLRIALGGVYYSLANWDEAVQQFQLAVQIKPDFANAHYNLSAAYREKGDFEKAVNAMESALSLVPADSADYQKASDELEALKKKLGEKAAATAEQPSETLQPPQPLPTGIEPPLELPQEVQPEITPTPTSEPTPTPEGE
jgi:tetratricopeptide (TPR) repeat protein